MKDHLTEEEIRFASHEIAKETLRELSDLAEEMEDYDYLHQVQKAYADFMEPIHRKMVKCG